MKTVRKLSFWILMLVIVIIFMQCSSAQKLQKEAPFKITEAYYQSWVSGVKGGGSGVNVFLDIVSMPQDVILDSIYFHGKGTKLELHKEKSILAIGRFKSSINQKQDIIMSNEPHAEYGNQVPKIPQKIPFQLNEDACVISYKEGNVIKYFKIDKLIKKEPKAYP